MRTPAFAMLLLCCVVSVSLAGSQSTTRSDEVVARIGMENVQASQLESRVGRELFQLRAQEYDLRRAALEELLGTELVERAANARHLTSAAFLKSIEDTVTPPNAEELKAGQARYPYEWTDDQVRAAIQQERIAARRRALVHELKRTYGVVISMPVPRTAVAEPSTAVFGSPDATVSVVMFSDFECRYSAQFAQTLQGVVRARPKDAKLLLRHAPRSQPARDAAAAALCANAQGRYWSMVERLFGIQRGQSARLDDIAAQVGLDAVAFEQCLRSPTTQELVAADAAVAEQLGVSGTPTTYIAGRQLVGVRPADILGEMLDEEVARIRNTSAHR